MHPERLQQDSPHRIELVVPDAGGDEVGRVRVEERHEGRAFQGLPVVRADETAIASWLERTLPKRATLDIRALRLQPSVGTSAGDLTYVADTLWFAPPALLAQPGRHAGERLDAPSA